MSSSYLPKPTITIFRSIVQWWSNWKTKLMVPGQQNLLLINELIRLKRLAESENCNILGE